MWASSIRYQASVGGKLRSLSWSTSKANDAETEESPGGWIVAGTEEGGVGVSWISREEDQRLFSSCSGSNGKLYKSSFNLKGHVGGVRLVRWRPQGDRLATYDSWGNIKVWKNRAKVLALDFDYSITAVVRDMQWSHCGCYIAVCTEDGHLQIFSGLNGTYIFSIQVVTSSAFGSHAQFTSLSWNKPTTSIALGTERGEVIDIDPLQHGRFMATMVVREGTPVLHACYFGPVKEINIATSEGNRSLSTQSLSLYLANGEVAIFRNLSSACCMCVHTRIMNGRAMWNEAQTILAVVGYYGSITQHQMASSFIAARLLDNDGNILLTVEHLIAGQPGTDAPLLQNICWALSDSVLFVAHDRHLFSMDVMQSIPSLLRLCRENIISNLWRHSHYSLKQLPLPTREIEILCSMSPSLLAPAVDAHLPFQDLLRSLSYGMRLHCIVVPENEATDSEDQLPRSFILKYEQFGSYVPLLRAKQRQRRFFSVRYQIYPVDRGERIRESGSEFWGQRPSSRSPSQVSRRTRGLRGSFRRYQSTAQATDSIDTVQSPQQELATNIVSNSKEEANNEDLPIIAEIEGNTVSKNYKFFSSYESGGSNKNPSLLGTLNVVTHYIKCEPRDITVGLSGSEIEEGLTLMSKKPEWNQQFGIFELDFGGRINRDSVKNFQIELRNEVVYQFGKSVHGHYCLDFQYPFSPVSAFCVALGSIS